MRMEIFSIGKFTLYGYGMMIGIGVILCILLGIYRAKKYHLKEEAVLDIAIWALVVGWASAKLLYVIVEFEDFMQDPMMIFSGKGFVVYGGIIGGFLAALFYCKKKGYSFLEYFDLLCPSISLAQGFGRIGCFLAGCCYGRETESFLGVVFPEGGLAPAGVKLLPTQLFSSAGDFLITAILLWYYKKNKTAGNVGALYLLLYGVGRFLIEFLRADERGGFGIFSTSQWISFLIVGIALALFMKNKNWKKKAE